MAILRFGTFNLLHGSSIRTGAADEADLRSAAGALDVDVLGLQEVDRGQPRSNKADQAAVVADELRAVVAVRSDAERYPAGLEPG